MHESALSLETLDLGGYGRGVAQDVLVKDLVEAILEVLVHRVSFHLLLGLRVHKGVLLDDRQFLEVYLGYDQACGGDDLFLRGKLLLEQIGCLGLNQELISAILRHAAGFPL